MKKVISILLVLLSLFLLAGCRKSKFEQQAEEIKNIKITVDKDVYEQTKEKIQETYDDLTHK